MARSQNPTARCAFTRFDQTKTGCPRILKGTNPKRSWFSMSPVLAKRYLWQLSLQHARQKIGRPQGRPLLNKWTRCPLQHLHAIHVNLVPADVPSDRNVM